MHQYNHYVNGFDHSNDGGVLGGSVQTIKCSAEGILSQHSVEPEK